LAPARQCGNRFHIVWRRSSQHRQSQLQTFLRDSPRAKQHSPNHADRGRERKTMQSVSFHARFAGRRPAKASKTRET
jgi:hypothetical protein